MSINLYEYSNSEIEEMGLPTPCECRETYRDYDDFDTVYDVCVECGASHRANVTVTLGHGRW